jgi:hypothetical protein
VGNANIGRKTLTSQIGNLKVKVNANVTLPRHRLLALPRKKKMTEANPTGRQGMFIGQ